MRHKRLERHGFTDTSRKHAALRCKQRKECAALPLLADQIAEAQPDEDTVMEARAVQWNKDQALTRAARAADWRRARRLALLSSNERTVLIGAWNGAPYPADPVYLLDFLHGYRVGRFTLDTLPFKPIPRDPHGRRRDVCVAPEIRHG